MELLCCLTLTTLKSSLEDDAWQNACVACAARSAFSCVGLINGKTNCSSILYIVNWSNHNVIFTNIIHKEKEIRLCFAALIAGWESEILPTDWGDKHPDGRVWKPHPAERRRDNPSEKEFIKVRYCIHNHTFWTKLKLLMKVFNLVCCELSSPETTKYTLSVLVARSRISLGTPSLSHSLKTPMLG